MKRIREWWQGPSEPVLLETLQYWWRKHDEQLREIADLREAAYGARRAADKATARALELEGIVKQVSELLKGIQ